MSKVLRVAVLGERGRLGSVIAAAVDKESDMELLETFDSADVVVDVTNAEAARENLPRVAAAGVHAVVGTTGLTEGDVAELDEAFEKSSKACFLVPNFAIGAVLMMKYAQDAAKYFDGVEIVELHHDQKKDAPSGTAALTAKRIGGDVPIHSVRLKGLVAHQEVLLGTTGQSLTIRHDTYDRTAFVPGALLSVRKIASLPAGVTVGLDAVL